MTAPRVSVLMPAYQAAPFIREAVESILRQSFADFELLVLDDGSTDGTIERLSGIGDPRIRVIVGAHRGLAGARNELLRVARGELVAVMDADDLAVPRRLELQVAFLDAHPHVGVVGGWLERFGLDRGVEPYPEEDRDIRRLLRTATAMPDGTMTARREAMRLAGGYDPAALWVDWDMGPRLAAVTQLHNLPEVLVHYRRHGGSLLDSVPRSERRREKARRRIQAARALGLRPRTVIDVGIPAAAALAYRLLDGSLPAPLAAARTVTVIVPTFGRPELLARALDGIDAQTRPADEVIAVVRVDDGPTRAAAEAWAAGGTRRRAAFVAEPGQVAALAAGVRSATGDVVAFLDDDAVPGPGWLDSLMEAYGPRVGGSGGRVLDVRDGVVAHGRARRVGRVSRFGRVVGRMHLEAPPQRVQWLTGGNVSYRRSLLRIDRRLRPNASGVEFANDVSMGLSVSGQGYALAFVPEARVVHESASAREAGTGLRTVSAADIEAAAHNLLVAVAGGRRGLSRLAALAFWFTVGTSTAPGPIRAAVGLLLGDLGGLRRLRPAFRGKRAALATLRARPADAPASRRREAAA